MIPRKKKLCSGCGEMKVLWRSNPPTCKTCEGKNVQRKSEGKEPIARKTIKTKPKPTVNGKPIYKAIYMAKFGYSDSDFVPSELSGKEGVDLHHIDCKGMGSSKNKDRVENLIALTREEHIEYGDKKQWMSYLYQKHMDFMLANGVKFDREWILGEIERYEDFTE